MLVGRKTGPLFLTDRMARPSVAKDDIDPTTGRARLSYRRAAELFEAHTDHYDDGPYTLHQLRHSRLTHAAEDGASTPVLMKSTVIALAAFSNDPAGKLDLAWTTAVKRDRGQQGRRDRPRRRRAAADPRLQLPRGVSAAL
jgi:hypothetical protein